MTIAEAPMAVWWRARTNRIGSLAKIGLTAATLAGALLCAETPAQAQQFTQQGSKLLASNGLGSQGERQANTVAVSADGNTAIVGAPADNNEIGAAFVWTRSGGVWTEQAKLVATPTVGSIVAQGWSVALSADGNTALIGAPGDQPSTNGITAAGAAFVFTRSNGQWTQQGGLLRGITSSESSQGYSVALSGDGNTAVIGGPADGCTEQNGGCIDGSGAIWVFTRSGNTWSQFGNKLVGSGGVPSGNAGQGFSVAISGDASTIVTGSPTDADVTGAAWIYQMSGGAWTQQGNKLVGFNEVGAADQGYSVALSIDGSTVILGGPIDNSYIGAAWVFVQQSAGSWVQQGAKLVANNPVGSSEQGISVALSADGNIALVGGPGDNGGDGAIWVYTRRNLAWNQRQKFSGSGATNGSEGADQGASVALSGEGTTAIVGGPADNPFNNNDNSIGAAWVFVSPSFGITDSHDFNGDGQSDILWHNTSGELAITLMRGGQPSSGAEFANVSGSWSVVGTRDFNGDGDADILWLDGSGDLAVWLMNGTTVSSGIGLGNVGTQWSVVGTGDFNGDGTGDILWRDSSGDLAIWLMNNGQLSSGVSLGQVASAWSVVGTGDFNGDGTTDILWYNTQTDDIAIWLMSNGQFLSGIGLGNVGASWKVVGTGDFNGDGTSDILWRDTSGDFAIWLLKNGQFSSGATIASGESSVWSVEETGDFNGDGKSDILWTDTSGDVAVWLMNGTSLSSGVTLGNIGTSWQVQGQNGD